MSVQARDIAARYARALERLERCFDTPVETHRDVAGVIQHFEMQYELAWKLLKRRLEIEGMSASSPRQAFRAAFTAGLIDDEALWLGMIRDRNLSVHTYDEALAWALMQRIQGGYLSAFRTLLVSKATQE
ncbi:MAG: HI0074 family nucleotidyltransferase substrate-binding subunit [Polyangiales bacterium]